MGQISMMMSMKMKNQSKLNMTVFILSNLVLLIKLTLVAINIFIN